MTGLEGIVRIRRGEGDPIVGEIDQTHDTGEEYLTTHMSIAVETDIIKLNVVLKKEKTRRTKRHGLLKLNLEQAKQLNKFLLSAIEQVEGYNEYAKQQEAARTVEVSPSGLSAQTRASKKCEP